MGELLQCYNKGCLQKFHPSENTEKSCTYHPGEPVFHDVYKSWSCCKKKTTDFTVFLSTKGCTTGLHNPEKPPEPEKSKNVADENSVIVVKAPKPPKSAPRLTGDQPKRRLTAVVAQSLKAHPMKSTSGINENDVKNTTEKYEIPIGTQCIRPSCTKTYDKNFDPAEACWYHNGVPIFHEGMKYWSCCQRKTSDFDSFLQQQGCTTGFHCFVKEKNEKSINNACRYDWHQTGDDLYVTIYSKLPQPADTYVDCDQVNLKAHVEYEDGNSIFDLDIPLWGAIEVENSQVTLTAAKVEVKMKKKEKVCWPKLMCVIQQQPASDLKN